MPAYSPYLNPIEKAFIKLKALATSTSSSAGKPRYLMPNKPVNYST